ncbi:hypothetical protein CC86DRAFT_406974 [Ophiobolus disseminans]|uniref:F-box domain-containing protein n=1 Tax=Ophiobolus disseminans TaxID=1469910 RepID=A0A6A6ZXW3_9PLEO|nr:hypothetical protein CC86DRAFT_406974 [Ophiobolus disseminans]
MSSLDTTTSSPLPTWLAKHMQFGFTADDVAALVDSIDSSQGLQGSTAAQLPAELLLLVLEHVPVDHLLDWRLICRGFRDAIDGRILFHHLRRTELLGSLGSEEAFSMSQLTPEQYDRLHVVTAQFQKVENEHGNGMSKSDSAIWSSPYAVFQIEDNWLDAFRDIFGIDAGVASTREVGDAMWGFQFDRLQLRRAEEGFGRLRWCIKLDQAVLDLSLPLESSRNEFNLEVELSKRTIRVRWKDMLFGFLKTEATLRRMIEKRQGSKFTFSLVEDCLREVRRQRLHAALNPDNRVDRHLKWSLRLLQPLFGKPRLDQTPLEMVEDASIHTLLLLRREAAMTPKQLQRLQQLQEDHKTMDREIDELSTDFNEFKSNMRPTMVFGLSVPFHTDDNLPRNPVAWPEDLRASIEGRVNKWKSQRKVIRQMHTLLSSSNEALAVPEDSFDNLGSQF